jgi:hypothetical protein
MINFEVTNEKLGNKTHLKIEDESLSSLKNK